MGTSSRDRRIAEIMAKLIKLYKETPKHWEGGILGSMTTTPHPIAVYAYLLFIHTNYSDKIVFPTLKYFEEELISDLNKYYGGLTGLLTSGGTESNFLALLAGRKTARDRNNIVVAPDTAHVSIDKACDIMGCRVIRVETGNKPVDPGKLEEYIRRYKPFAVVITAGTTERGLVDPVKPVADIALDTNTYLHVDAAYGGLLIPHLYRNGYLEHDLKFYEGVSSISIDFHKNGMTPIPSSILLFSNKEYKRNVCYKVSYMLSGETCGLLGTRPGGALAATWAIWKYMGWEGFRELSLNMMKLAIYLYERLNKIKGIIAYKPILPIIPFTHVNISYEILLKELLKRKYYLYKSPSLKALRIVIMPHTRKKHLDEFLETLEEILEKSIEKK